MTLKKLFILLLLIPSSTVFAQQDTLPPNPFTGFETHVLPNGLKVWFKNLPDDPNVMISVAIPFGSGHDPVGKEELAHFTEHMLFSDHLGRTEEEIKREVEDLGGSRNGMTYWDHTYYYVSLDKQYGLFALEWLYRIISPHEMHPEIVDRQREPVAVEVGARPRELMDWIQAYYIYPPWLRLPNFWEREFGLTTRHSRDYYPYRSLYSITPEDLRRFYETYYVPSLMTLTVIGDFDREAVLTKIHQTFATLPKRPAPQRDSRLHDPQRHRQTIYWDTRANVYFETGYKFYQLTAEDHQMLLFIRALLDRRLEHKLRYGERKAVYGIWTRVSLRGPATYFSTGGDIKKAEFTYAREVIEQELKALQTGSLPDEEFATEQRALARNLRIRNIHAEDLGWWVTRSFYEPDLHQDFPDLVTFFEQVTKEEVADFVRQHFVPERRVVYTAYPWPVNQAILAVIPLIVGWLTVKFARRILIKPVDMTRIRYVARFKIPAAYELFLMSILGVIGLILVRLVVYAYSWFNSEFVVGIDNFWTQGTIHGFTFIVMVFLGIWGLSRIPHKLLVFEDHVRIKSLFYWSRRIMPEDIVEITPHRFQEIWCSRKLWKCIPLLFGVFSPGLYLRLRNGWAYFFRVRQNHECQTALRDLISRTSEANS